MNSKNNLLLSTLATSILLAAGHGHAATTLFDYTFDNVANDVGPAVQVFENNVDTIAAGSASTSTGLITTGTASGSAAGAANSHTIGFNSSATVSLAGYNSFTATFVVDSINLSVNVTDLLYNGMFFGVVKSTSVEWNNLAQDSFGYVPGSGARGDHNMARNETFTFTYDTIASTQPTNASLIDGFTVSMTVNDDDTWSVSSTGLSTELSDSGSMTGLWADFSGGVGIYTSLQGKSGGQLDMSRMTLTAVPEPSGAALTGVFGTLFLLRRRRQNHGAPD